MNYDIIVIGGGHAGIEASLAAAKMGAKTLLITILAEQIGAASCNPAIGGLAKGHLVKELDALGGQMGRTTDECGIQFRILNESKGPAVRGSRAQIDMDKYRIYMRNLLLNTPNLDITQEIATEILSEFRDDKPRVTGVKTHLDNIYSAKKVIITTGTFLNGVIHTGTAQLSAGRVGELSSTELSKSLADFGLNLGRLKTGTCPRIDAKSIDLASLKHKAGTKCLSRLAFARKILPQISFLAISATQTSKRMRLFAQIFTERHFLLDKLGAQVQGIVLVSKPKFTNFLRENATIFSLSHKRTQPVNTI